MPFGQLEQQIDAGQQPCAIVHTQLRCVAIHAHPGSVHDLSGQDGADSDDRTHQTLRQFPVGLLRQPRAQQSRGEKPGVLLPLNRGRHIGLSRQGDAIAIHRARDMLDGLHHHTIVPHHDQIAVAPHKLAHQIHRSILAIETKA